MKHAARTFDEVLILMLERSKQDGSMVSFEFFDFALDLLGVPRDNTVETHACEIANTTGEWPASSYCRDWVYDLWVEDGMSVTEYIKRVREELENHKRFDNA